ncbi:MAG: hypothetical protein ACOCQA_01760 [bacterium]
MNKIIVLLLTLSFLLSLTFSLSAESLDLKTLEGKISTAGSAPATYTVLTENNDQYSISGDLKTKLASLEGSRVRVTAYIKKAKHPQTTNDLEVIDFSIIDPGFDQRPVINGKIYSSNSKYFILSEEQVIYFIQNADALDLKTAVSENKSIIAAGPINHYQKYKAEIYIESYKVY